MPDMAWGLIGISVFLILLTTGMRVAFCALLAGLVMLFGVFGSVDPVAQTITGFLQQKSMNYPMTVIPLFVLMGYIAFQYGIGTEIFNTVRAWVGWLPGGLAVSTTISCAAFGAITGASPAAVAAFGKLAYPEMEKSKYHWTLSVGSIAASGTLADLIPPSTLMVIYGMLASQSIGKLLMAGFLPGILSASIYSIMMIARCIRDPKLGPAGESTTWSQKLSSLKNIWIVVVVMGVILGGLYSGVFTPTEVAAWSCFILLIFSIIKVRGIHWPLLKKALMDTARTSCMVFATLLGVTLMTTGFISTGLLGWITDFFLNLQVSPYILLLAAAVLYIFLGAFIGVMGMLVMTVPFIVPILMEVGFDPIWLGVIVIKFCELGMITPPIGGNVFIIAQMTGRPLTGCFRAIIWFGLMDLLTIGVLIIFPGIVLFLPSLM